MKTSILCALALVLLCAGAVRATEPWRDSNYGYRKKITADAPGGDLSDFPFLVHLDGTTGDPGEDIGDQVQADVDDIRFYDGDGNLLPYEVEYYNIGDLDGDGDDNDLALECWVGHDFYSSPSGDQNCLWMYYGYASAANGEGDPWDANFKAVWHANEADANNLNDSSGTGNDLTKKGNDAPADVGGQIYNGQEFDGANDYASRTMTVGSDGSQSFSAWVYVHSDGEDDAGRIYERALGGYAVVNGEAGGAVEFQYLVYDQGTYRYATSNTTPIALNTWTHVAGHAQNGTAIELYVDGSEVGGYANQDTPASNIENDSSVVTRMGNRTDDRTFDGVLDELRISDTYRSADWIAYEHANMGGNADYEQTWSAEESKPAAGGGVPAWMHFRRMRSH